MTPQDLGQGAPEGLDVQIPFEAERIGDVVRGEPRLETVDEPEALLGEGERDRPTAVETRDRAAAGRRGARVQESRQRLHRGSLEDRAQRHLDAQDGTQARDHLGRQQRVPAQVEEVVAGAHAVNAEHLLPHPRDFPLGRCPRRRGRSGPDRWTEGSRKRAAVDLAAGRERQLVQHHDRRWHHHLGKARAGQLPQLRNQAPRQGGKPGSIGEPEQGSSIR